MNTEEITHLRFRRQYILSPKSIDCPFLYNSLKVIGGYILYAHKDLLVTEYKKEDLHLILLGDIFDYIPQKNNWDILKEIAYGPYDLFLDRLSKYSGCFVLIYIQNNRLFIVTDATSTKKVYHCKIQDKVWCASQPHLLAKVTKTEKTKNPSKLEYYNSREFLALSNASVGDITIYDEICQLSRNHYLDVIKNQIIRFYPKKRLEKISLEECANKCAKMIKGYVESIALRYDIMLPVTAGKDSRVLLAGTRNVKEKVYYYINKEKQLTEESNDIKIPKSLFKRLNLDFHILEVNTPVSEYFKRIYYENNPLASESFLPIIYNYFLNFPNKANLPGNIASTGIWHYPVFRKERITAEMLAKINSVSRFSFPIEEYSKWLADASLCSEDNFQLMNLFYWEERLGNWGTQTGLDKEIAQLEFNPYNSRELVETILSIKQPYRTEHASYSLHTAIIKELWPELSEISFNPSYKNTLFRVFEIFGLLGTVHKFKCK